jgi:hypothetical protein
MLYITRISGTSCQSSSGCPNQPSCPASRRRALFCSVARSLQAFTATPSKNHGYLGTFHGHQIIFVTATFTAIFLDSFPAIFYSFSTQILLLLAFLRLSVVPSPAGVPCLKLVFLLLLGSLLLLTFLLLLAFLLLLGCHKFKAVNREDKRCRRYRDRDFGISGKSRRYRDR